MSYTNNFTEIIIGRPVRHRPLYLGAVPRENSYHINFSDTPSEILRQYLYGEKVTRENLMAMLLESFIIARADLPTQYFYLEYLYLKTGFDYTITFERLFTYPNTANPWENLTTLERDYFLDLYKKFSSHSEITSDEMINEFNNNFIRIFLGDTNKFLGELDTIMPLDEIAASDPLDFRAKLLLYRKEKLGPQRLDSFK